MAEHGIIGAGAGPTARARPLRCRSAGRSTSSAPAMPSRPTWPSPWPRAPTSARPCSWPWPQPRWSSTSSAPPGPRRSRRSPSCSGSEWVHARGEVGWARPTDESLSSVGRAHPTFRSLPLSPLCRSLWHVHAGRLEQDPRRGFGPESWVRWRAKSGGVPGGRSGGRSAGPTRRRQPLAAYLQWGRSRWQRNLVLTLTGPDRIGIVESVTGLLVARGGNVEMSRMARLGGEFAILMLVSAAGRAGRRPGERPGDPDRPRLQGHDNAGPADPRRVASRLDRLSHRGPRAPIMRGSSRKSPATCRIEASTSNPWTPRRPRRRSAASRCSP